jgi:hypothetical protein
MTSISAAVQKFKREEDAWNVVSEDALERFQSSLWLGY